MAKRAAVATAKRKKVVRMRGLICCGRVWAVVQGRGRVQGDAPATDYPIGTAGERTAAVRVRYNPRP
jgi:hypothetical protein